MENYKNPALTPEERAEDLLSRMTLKEKIGQINITRGVEFHVNSLADGNTCTDRNAGTDGRGRTV